MAREDDGSSRITKNHEPSYEMSSDERWVREKWNKMQRVFRKRTSKASHCAKDRASLSTRNKENRDPRCSNITAYDRGYQAGLKASLAGRFDSAVQIPPTKQPTIIKPLKKTPCDDIRHEQIEKGGEVKGYNKAWDVIRRDGWTQGCVHCCPHLRHELRNGEAPQGPRGGVPKGGLISLIPDTRTTRNWQNRGRADWRNVS